MSEAAAEGILSLYQRHAAAFARRRNRDLMERGWLDAFLSEVPQGAEVLDLGCGTGQPMAGYMAQAGCRVTGVDGAAAMIERAQAALPGQRWIVADMRSLPPLGPFDGVIAWHSFFHLTPAAQEAMFPRFRDLTRPGAPLMFTSGTGRGIAMGEFEGEPLYHGSLDTAEYCTLLGSNGFEVLRHVVEDRACGGATVWLARRSEA
ncbi:class I SAM-dependent methyltransferase [Pseudooceanicola sp. LIPI14-2-Ac024]|uniref:class I SAM-dependent methyltransferase n=1 Tax=Pseudooceanicola sp. LIPI14-2-Ac024 TaxID=3344875 RepID=UPI0035CFD3BC